MKMTTMIVMVAGGLSVQAVAADPTNAPSAPTKLQTQTAPPLRVQTAIPLSISQLAKPTKPENYHIERYGNISSRPWDMTAGGPPAPLFEDQREYVDQPNFNLFWIGATPP